MNNETNIDKIVNKLLVDNLTPSKIRAFSYVIQALKGITTAQPNEVRENPNDSELTTDLPFKMNEVTHIQIDNGERQEI